MPTPLQVEGGELPKRVLVCGTPQLVQGWVQRMQESSEGRVQPRGWQIQELGEIHEDTLAEIGRDGSFDLILDCQLGSNEIRQFLLELLAGVLAKDGQIWTHTLTAPSTIPVGVLPREVSAVGFSGLPPLWDEPIVELSQPSSGEAEDLERAAATALALGLKPFDVPDEPGAVIPRLLAMLVNATSFLHREGVVASPAAADRVARHGFAMHTGPFRIADTVGLDVVEGVLMALAALYGEDRYRVCPDIILRIEAGMVGKITGRGYYVT
jgi:3-hydroxybutyryl-CoA dehydrogenase